MSLTAFEQWWALWRSQHEHADAGECVIAVRNFYETRIAALQSERDMLGEALEDISQYWNGLENTSATHDACEHNLRVARLALSIPASGEPARKP